MPDFIPSVTENDLVSLFIQDFSATKLQGYLDNINWYTAKHPILERSDVALHDSEGNVINKPNSKLVFQFPKLIIDTSHSYLVGKPLSYSNNTSLNKPEYDNTDEFVALLHDVFIDNDESYKTAELLKNCSIEGDAYEYVYISKVDGLIKFVEFPAIECIPIYDASTRELQLVIRFYQMEELFADGRKEIFYKIEIYDNEYVKYYEMRNGAVVMDLEKTPFAHQLKEVPVIHYKNNSISNSDYGLSDLEDVKTLVTEFEDRSSDLSNTLQYNTNPLLKLTNCIIDEQQFAEMVASRIIQLPEGATADYLVWNQNIPALKEHLDKIEDSIYTFSFTPKLYRDNSDGNPMSGISIKMKFSSADLKANTKERNYRLGLKKRVRLIAKLTNMLEGKNYNWRDVDILFNRSIPQNLLELAQIAVQLKGLVSDETLLGTIPFVTDVKTEEDRMKKQTDAASAATAQASAAATALLNANATANSTNTDTTKVTTDKSGGVVK
jgi:SPP1 family phage portal protein